VVAAEVQQLQTHAQSKSLNLLFEPPSKKLPPIALDENKTRQVIMNFIDNAIYYTPLGGNIKVRLRPAGSNIQLEVKDSGIGVPVADQPKLFSKFYRADNAQKMRPDGTGLGLYLAKRVVEEQGGKIIFHSTEGRGSTFGFSFPVRVASPKVLAGKL
jgi:signal transduction histidine kinase